MNIVLQWWILGPHHCPPHLLQYLGAAAVPPPPPHEDPLTPPQCPQEWALLLLLFGLLPHLLIKAAQVALQILLVLIFLLNKDLIMSMPVTTYKYLLHKAHMKLPTS